MSYSENTQRLLASYDACNRRDLEAVFVDVADDYLLVDHALGVTATTKDEARAWMEAMLAGSSDMQARVIDVVETADSTVVRVSASGTHDGDFSGIPATGNPINIEQCELHRFNSAGQLSEVHIYYDMYGLLVQLGVAPALPAAV